MRALDLYQTDRFKRIPTYASYIPTKAYLVRLLNIDAQIYLPLAIHIHNKRG